MPLARQKPWRTPLGAAGAFVAFALVSACGPDNRYAAPPPPRVTVAAPMQQPVTVYLEANGNAAAINSVNLIARIQGFIQEIHYQDGTVVHRGDALFTIEPEPYRLKLEQAQAAEAGAKATLDQTEAEYQRQVELMSRQVASKAALDNARANRDSARAKLAQAQVDIKQAEINLGYTKVMAPFDGFVTPRLVSIGDYVGATNAPTTLATIVQLDPIYVNFNVSEADVLRIRADLARRGLTGADMKGTVPVEVGLQNESGYPHSGTLDYISATINPATGTLAARGRFDNPTRLMLPGYFLRVRVPVDRMEQALLVPDVAIGSDQSGRYVLLVGADDVVEQRKVTLGPTVGELRVIESGVKAGDRVIVAGILRAIPGQKVDPQTQGASAGGGEAAPKK